MKRCPRTSRRAAARARRGIAVLAVLLVLLALFVLCAPFLMATRNAARASQQLADTAQGRLALDSAARFARSELGHSHPSLDPTPFSDSEDELALAMTLDARVLDPHDRQGVMWDAQATDVAGEIDLNSAPPQVFANLLGASTRLNQAVKPGDAELLVQSTAGFADSGFLWVGGELIGYAERQAQSFKRLSRGLGSSTDSQGQPLDCGPRPATGHAPGTPVVDQRAWAPVLWRISGGDGAVRAFDAPERVRAAASFALAGLAEDDFRAWENGTSVFAGVRAGAQWQRGVRVLNSLQGGVSCRLSLSSARWLAPGSTLEIRDGRTLEYAVVQELTDEGVRLDRPVTNDYAAFGAVVRPLSRRPVNANTASAATLETVFANVQMRGVNSRITREEARTLADLVVASRPFDGFEDFVRRLVLPAGGLEPLPEDAPVHPAPLRPQAGAAAAGVIDAQDAVALYINALNANDARLAVSTMPLTFTSRDVYTLDLRAAVNAPSGLERSSARREQVELVVPQSDLLHVFGRQEDFDEALRLSLESPYWISGPGATSRFDGGNTPASRLWAHLGTWNGAPYVPGVTQLPAGVDPSSPPTAEHVFASREDDGWVQLEPARTVELGRRAGRMLHFDHETRDLEGRYLPDGRLALQTADQLVAWTPPNAATGFLRALSFEAWIKPRQVVDGVVLDVGSTLLDVDRVTLAMEGNDLVLRVLDGAGDHPATVGFKEAGEARYSLQPGGRFGGAGLAVDTWSHVSVDVRGTRPDQITLLVDGSAQGVRTPGLSRLASAFPDGATFLSLEDDEGFPDRCVVRIGQELVEARRTGKNVFDCSRATAGPDAGFGGRLARMEFELASTAGVEPGTPVSLALSNFVSSHATGTPVELYGYSLPLDSNVPDVKGELTADVGRFAVGVVERFVGGQNQNGDALSANINTPAGPVTVGLGTGIKGASSQVNGIVLRPADTPMAQADLMNAFSVNGGYAAIVQRTLTNYIGAQGSGVITGTSDGDPIGGIEIVRYTGHDATTLYLAPRPAPPPANPFGALPHAFVSKWQGWATANNNVPLDQQLEWGVFVVPISIPIKSVGGSTSFQPATAGSQFAQITHVADAQNTEWVRYDAVTVDALVRNDPNALVALEIALTHGASSTVTPPNPNPPPGPNAAAGPNAPLAPPASPGPPGPASASQAGGAFWNPFVADPAAPPDLNWPVTYAARTAFQFRGVGGTYPQVHAVGMPVLPTFRVLRGGPDEGWPGRQDAAVLFDAGPQDPGAPVRVHRAWRPRQYTQRSWVPGATLLEAAAGTTGWSEEDNWVQSAIWVALEDRTPRWIGGNLPNTSGTPNFETRELARLVLHPSGERPRLAAVVALGSTIRGGSIPPVVIDEVLFGDAALGDNSPSGNAVQGAQLSMQTGLSGGSMSFQVQPQLLRTPRGLFASGSNVLSILPTDAGLLRIGGEIVCYQALDASSGTIALAPGGRGLLGTHEEVHEPGETVTWLEGWPVTTLAGGVGEGTSVLPLTDLADFPQEGTVRIDGELIHYSATSGGSLWMPRASSEPGRMDGQGGGLFRGRFGTPPAAHAALTPVVLHPQRYWDRWSERADAPELAYFGFEIDQPNAFWRHAFYQAEEPSSGLVRAGVLQRVTRHAGLEPAWDAQPDEGAGLRLLAPGVVDGANPIGSQADRIEWRAFATYKAGAFDALTATAHGWKESPRLRLLGVTYLGPDLVLRRVDR